MKMRLKKLWINIKKINKLFIRKFINKLNFYMKKTELIKRQGYK